MIASHGKGALLAKVDLKHTFHQCPVCSADWPLLGYTWEDKYYFDVRLPFGLRSAPALFNMLADAIHWICLARGVGDLEHYLDDYITAGPLDSDVCLARMFTILGVCTDIGMLVSADKVLGPSNQLPILGVEFDTVRQEMRLPAEKLLEYSATVSTWLTRRSSTAHELDSLLGILFYACRVVVPGRSFLQQLLGITHGACRPHHHIRINQSARLDISWWDAFLSHWNGRSFFYADEWQLADHMQLYTDASGSVGFGAVWAIIGFMGFGLTSLMVHRQ